MIAERATPHERGAIQVLIVEDDASTLFAYAQELSRAGFDAVKAETGQAALDLLHRGFQPAVAVVDLRLPDMSGTDVLTYLHDDPVLRHVPTIVVTGADPDRTGTVTADATLFKPIGDSELGTVVAALHGRSTVERGRRQRRERKARSTTLPETPAPELRCPQCDRPLRYQKTIFNGVSPVERWDRYTCAGCGEFEYRHRTRHLRRSPA
jgi:response regulator RpfG family c-di-GMP phosphodiesterase